MEPRRMVRSCFNRNSSSFISRLRRSSSSFSSNPAWWPASH
jgi:hypothetical protein